jgi:hypothetical protein
MTAALSAIGHRKVRVIVRENTEATSEFFHLVDAAHRKTTWTYAEWKQLLRDLDECELTVDEWRMAN